MSIDNEILRVVERLSEQDRHKVLKHAKFLERMAAVPASQETRFQLNAISTLLSQSSDWVLEADYENRRVWRHAGGAGVADPKRVGSDFDALVYLACTTIATAEHRSVDEVLWDLSDVQLIPPGECWNEAKEMTPKVSQKTWKIYGFSDDILAIDGGKGGEFYFGDDNMATITVPYVGSWKMHYDEEGCWRIVQLSADLIDSSIAQIELATGPDDIYTDTLTVTGASLLVMIHNEEHLVEGAQFK